MRAVAYIRVSNLSQVDGHSLDAQERLIHELCKSRGWEEVRVYREEGRSAHVEAIAKRPAFRKLLDDAAKREFDVVVVHTLDRWSRNQRVSLEALATLGRHNIGLVSISENFDYSTPEGRLSFQMLGAVAQYFSDSLSKHVQKGQDQRAHEGKHLGGLPFGYESCWVEERGERRRRCDPEHLGGVHLVPHEAEAVRELFRRYASGTATLTQLAAWLNDQGLRTRNMHNHVDHNGDLVAGPRLFTTASVRGILHNPFYAGLIRYKGEANPGIHEPVVSQDVFELVQDAMKKNSGRSRTLTAMPERHYLLKGLVRCAWCGMPMWAQTYKNGQQYYREHRESRSIAPCPAHGGSIPCHVADEQVGTLIEAIELEPEWLEAVLARIAVRDEVERVRIQRLQVQEKLKRLGKAYLDLLVTEEEFKRRKLLLDLEMESLVVPQANAAEEAGRLVQDLPRLWAGANEEERHRLLLTM
ncbi:MAG: recombinase family protein, partial [Chloroflexi bacterium]|nr:recombinase family protein [Chloroflexota bacterium]